MINYRDRSQKELPINIHGLNNKKYEYLENSVFGIFRKHFLSNLPIDFFEKNFCKDFGRKTKDLKSMVGLFIFQLMLNLTDKNAIESFMYDQRVKYALDIDEYDSYLAVRTFYYYKSNILENEYDIFESTLKDIVEKLDLDHSIQRTDSTIIELNLKNMSQFDLFRKTISLFLRETKREHPRIYTTIPENITKYNQDDHEDSWFTKFKPNEIEKPLLQAAKDVLHIQSMFANHRSISKLESFKKLVRLIDERITQSDDDEKISVKLKDEFKGSAMVNPHDDTAQYSGHKKKIGVKLTISETCSEDVDTPNPNIITNVEVDAANLSDQNILQDTIDHREKNNLKPNTELTDNGYDSEENVTALDKKDVELISPPTCKENDGFAILDFDISEDGREIVTCPNQKQCIKNKVNEKTGITRSYFDRDSCANCPHQEECPIKVGVRVANFEWKWSRPRMEARFIAFFYCQMLAVIFRQRAGGEAVFSQLKNSMGLKRLRVRGHKKSKYTLVMAAVALNILRTSNWILSNRSSAPKK